MPKTEITNEDLRRILEYDALTGDLRLRSTPECDPWKPIGKGYLSISLLGGKFYKHRLVWQYHYGVVPGFIDHIDGDKHNNRVENLRECTNAQNQYNSKRKSNNRSGFKGVAFCTGYRKPWRARIVVDKQPITLGYFETPEEAAAAYAVGAAQHAKEFARID